MKIENLQVGMEFKNWNYLCETLGVEPRPSGKARKPQEKEFKKYFDWTKQGQKIIITEIKKSTCCPELNKLIKDNEVLFSENESLSMYENIINQIEGNSLKQLIAKSIINQLYLQVNQVGKVGFKDCWWVTDAELYKATGMISDSHFYAIRNPKRFCEKMPELTENNLDEVLDHMGVNKEWLKKQRSRVLKYLVNDLHLITHYENAYFFIMKTTRIINHTAYTDEEYYYPTLDELEWINKDVIPKVMRQHKDANGKEYTSLVKIKYDGKIKEFYQEWLPKYLNSNLPTGWGIVTGIYKCHRIGFSQDVIECAVNSNMKLLTQERKILDEIANSIIEMTRSEITEIRNKQAEKRYEKAMTDKCDSEETREIRCRESYIGVGYVVNKECHSNEASYKDYTQKHNYEKTIVSKIIEN